jgi:hypothetical protein
MTAVVAEMVGLALVSPAGSIVTSGVHSFWVFWWFTRRSRFSNNNSSLVRPVWKLAIS